MGLGEVIQTLNQLRSDGVIEQYAIGGAIGASFYLEPVATLDVDVFVHFRPDPSSPLINLKPIFDDLKARGAKMEGEYVLVAEWPVQFLAGGTPLIEEALEQAVERMTDGAVARVFTAEHLAAIALQTGRAKDLTRVLQFIEEARLDGARFEAMIIRHGLSAAWGRFKTRFLDTAP